MKPATSMVAPASVALDASVIVSPESSATAVPPPVNVAVAPAMIAGGTCTSTVLTGVALRTTPSLTVQPILRGVAIVPVVAKLTASNADW